MYVTTLKFTANCTRMTIRSYCASTMGERSATSNNVPRVSATTVTVYKNIPNQSMDDVVVCTPVGSGNKTLRQETFRRIDASVHVEVLVGDDEFRSDAADLLKRFTTSTALSINFVEQSQRANHYTMMGGVGVDQ